MTYCRTLLVSLAIAAVTTVPAVAHHPFAAEFDWKKPVTLKGKITEVVWSNPHAELRLEGTDESGAMAPWSVELGGLAALARAGWTRDTLKPGERVTVDGWLARDGRKRVSAKSVMLPGGRELFAASSFFDAKGPKAVATSGVKKR